MVDQRDGMRKPAQEGFNEDEIERDRGPQLPESGFTLIHPDLADDARAAQAANLLSPDEEADATPESDEAR